MWFLLILLLPFAGLAYVGWHVWTLLPLPPVYKAVIVALGVMSVLLMFPVFKGVPDRMPLLLARVTYEVSTSSLIVLLYLVLTFLALDLLRLVRVVPSAWMHANWTTTAILGGALLALFVYGNIHYNNKVRVPINLECSWLPHGVKVVMLSDMHLGYHNTRADLARWVDMINEEHASFILIAGDIIDRSVRPLTEEGMAEEFHRLNAPVYACLGNHEYFARTPKARQFFKEAGICLLCDSAVVTAENILIIGRDDRSNRWRKPLAELKSQAMTRLRPSGEQGQGRQPDYTIVMDHQPYNLQEAEEAGIDLQLSGHTHRGQVWPLSWITDALYECSWGSHQRGSTHYYVSSGIGIWGGKFRIGTQSEYVVATIGR